MNVPQGSIAQKGLLKVYSDTCSIYTVLSNGQKYLTHGVISKVSKWILEEEEAGIVAESTRWCDNNLHFLASSIRRVF